MTSRERLSAVLSGEKADRLPVIEWAGWWEQTLEKWKEQNPNCPMEQRELYEYLW